MNIVHIYPPILDHKNSSPSSTTPFFPLLMSVRIPRAPRNPNTTSTKKGSHITPNSIVTPTSIVSVGCGKKSGQTGKLGLYLIFPSLPTPRAGTRGKGGDTGFRHCRLASFRVSARLTRGFDFLTKDFHSAPARHQKTPPLNIR